MRNVLSTAEPLAESTWRDPRSTSRVLELGYRGSEAHCTPTAKEILAAVQATLERIGTKAQLCLAPRLPVLRWMFKGQDLLSLRSNESRLPSEALHPPSRLSAALNLLQNPLAAPSIARRCRFTLKAWGQHSKGAGGLARRQPELECTEGPRGHDLPLSSSSAGYKTTNKKEPLAIVFR